MLSKLRKRFTYANMMVTIAVVFAMTGGAYAAKKYIITSTKQIKPSVLKQLQGKTGSAGPAGPAGMPGAAGAPGKNGSPGEKGAQGDRGPEGPAGPTGPAGATGVKGTTGTTGPAGPTGPEGVCSSVKCVLPAGQTEKGVWSALIVESPVGTKPLVGAGPISFVVPLSATPTPEFIEEGQAGKQHATECPGTPLEPKAAAGFFCIYMAEEGFEAAKFHEAVMHPFGALLRFEEGLASGVTVDGTWAVTAK